MNDLLKHPITASLLALTCNETSINTSEMVNSKLTQNYGNVAAMPPPIALDLSNILPTNYIQQNRSSILNSEISFFQNSGGVLSDVAIAISNQILCLLEENDYSSELGISCFLDGGITFVLELNGVVNTIDIYNDGEIVHLANNIAKEFENIELFQNALLELIAADSFV